VGGIPDNISVVVAEYDLGIPPRVIIEPMKLGVSLPHDLVVFADEEARRRRTTRSGYLAHLLETERLREQVRRYIDRHGWDVAEDDEAWRQYQQRRMREDYGDDEW
jgi:hypothetical protein